MPSEYVSNCCGAKVDLDYLICSECKEPCEAEEVKEDNE